ncbi:hypothetical protein ACE60T_005359 [Salmonella enterica]
MTRRYPAVSWPGYACNTEEFPVKNKEKALPDRRRTLMFTRL